MFIAHLKKNVLPPQAMNSYSKPKAIYIGGKLPLEGQFHLVACFCVGLPIVTGLLEV